MEAKILKKFSKKLVGLVLSATLVVGGIVNASASTTYKDEWYLSRITPTTGTTTDTVSMMYNPGNKYTGVCSRSTSTYDSVAMAGGANTTITSSVLVYRQAGDVQTVTATVSGTSATRKANFKMTLTCNNGTAVNEGYVYWVNP